MKIFYLPDLGEGLAEAEIREWYIKEGDVVSVDQPLLSMETAKAVVDVPSPEAGRIVKLFGVSGDMIKTHAPLVGFHAEEQKGELEHPHSKDKGTVVGNLEESETILEEHHVIVGQSNSNKTASLKALPAIRALAKQLHVDLNLVKPSGSHGHITAEDVKQFAQTPLTSSIKKETLHGARHFMAKAMMESHQHVVPVTLTDDADITHFSEKTDFTVRIIQALIAGVKKEPALNAWFDGKTMVRQLHTDIEMGLAVDTEEGLFVPVIRNAMQKNASELRNDINLFKNGVKNRSLKPHDFQGATITLSNFGVFAGRYATLIIVPPMVAILGSGKVRDMAAIHEGRIEIRRILPLSLSFDHRAITGGEAARFLFAVISDLEKSE